MASALLEAVAELADRGVLAEGFHADALKLRALAAHRHRSHGRFADEAPRIPSVRVRPGDRPYVDNQHALAHTRTHRYDSEGLTLSRDERALAYPRTHKHDSEGLKLPNDEPSKPGDADLEMGAKARGPRDFNAPFKGTRAWTHDELEDEPERVLRGGGWPPDRAGTFVQALLADDEPFVLGTTLDTQKAFKTAVGADGRPEYSEARLRLHRAIAREFLRGLPQDRANPEIVFLAGGMASGKSTLLRSGAVKKPDQSVLVSADAIKGMLPEYALLLASKDPDAAGRVHEESSDVAAMVTRMALARRMNVTVDKTKVKPKDVQTARDLGYSPRAAVATVEIQVARERSAHRYQETGRFARDENLIPSHQFVSANFEKWVEETKMPFVLVDTRRQLMVATAENGTVTVHHPTAYALFKRRATVVDSPLGPNAVRADTARFMRAKQLAKDKRARRGNSVP